MSDLSDSVLRKIGRNVYNLQKIEGMLKFFLSRVNFQGPISQLAKTLESKRKRYEKMTLGQVVNEYLETYNLDVEPIHQHPENIEKGWLSFSFDTEINAGHLPELQKDIKFMVTERNRLIHEMLIAFNPDSIESCEALIIDLDKQNEKTMVEFKGIQDKLQLIDDGFKLFVSHQLKNIKGKSSKPIHEDCKK